MKRASVSSHKKGRRPQVLSSSSNESPRRNQQFAAGSSSSEEDEKNIQKRARVIQQRMSVIQIEKLANRKGSNGGEKKRKSNQAGFSSGVSSEGDGSPDENSTNKPKILRRRLTKKFRQSHSSNDNNGRHNSISGRSSLASVLSLGNLSDVSVFGAKKAPTDQKTLRAIYSTCSALFQAHKITPQNAFSLKLVECLDEIIESDDFDRRNLPLLARTIEIGGKIYTCRVDCTHANTIKLVNELALNQNHPLLDEGQEDQAAQLEILQDVPEDEGNKKSAAKRKKRSRFIEENESKLNTGFEDQTAKYYLRRTDLKSKFHRNVEEESDFDYISYILKPGEANPFKSEGEREALGCKALIPDSHNDPDEMTTVPWLPFHALTEWDAKKFDLWGEPLPNSDALNVSEMQRPASPIAAANEVENEFAYNPENRPDEYPAAENDSLASFGDGFQDNFEEEKPTVNADGSVDRPLALDELRSLDDLRKFFGQLQRNEVQMKEKYGWAGPVFLKPQRPLAQKTIKVKKEKKKKAVLMLNFEDIDWKDKANRYQVVESSKTTLDDRTLEKWRKTKTTRPFSSSVNFMGWEEDEEEFRAPFDSNPAVDDPLANITRFFVDANRDIFQLMEGEFRAGNLNGAEEADSSGNGPFSSREWSPGDEMDLEAARDYPEEERALEIEQAVEQVDNLAGLDLSAMFPGTQALGTSLTGTSEIDAIRFARRPKPIDMHALKDLIRKILQENLKLDDEGKPSLPVETKFELKALISELMKRADSRMAKHLSVAIIVVGLMHVVAEKKLFMENGGDNPSVVCKGTEWRHKDNIPLGSIHPME